jgi:hypothetical protein
MDAGLETLFFLLTYIPLHPSNAATYQDRSQHSLAFQFVITCDGETPRHRACLADLRQTPGLLPKLKTCNRLTQAHEGTRNVVSAMDAAEVCQKQRPKR